MSTPLYRRIAAELRHAITTGELPPGSQLPTEQELGDRYKVSRNTVRLALGLLTNEGIITSTPGRGTFVRDRIMLTYHAARAEAADRPDDWHTDAYFTEVRQQVRQPSQRSTCASTRPPWPSLSASKWKTARSSWSGA